MDSRQQVTSTHSILSEIEAALIITQDTIEAAELLWVRDMLREHISEGKKISLHISETEHSVAPA